MPTFKKFSVTVQRRRDFLKQADFKKQVEAEIWLRETLLEQLQVERKKPIWQGEYVSKPELVKRAHQGYGREEDKLNGELVILREIQAIEKKRNRLLKKRRQLEKSVYVLEKTAPRGRIADRQDWYLIHKKRLESDGRKTAQQIADEIEQGRAGEINIKADPDRVTEVRKKLKRWNVRDFASCRIEFEKNIN